MQSLLCPKEPASLFFFQQDVPSLLYYSHIPGALILLSIGVFVFARNTKALSNRLLLFIGITFFFWSIFDVLLWTLRDTRVILFLWSVLILLEPLFFAASFYLAHVFIKGRDMGFLGKSFIILLLLPFFILLPTAFILEGVKLDAACEGPEGLLAIQYAYFVQFLFIILIIDFGIYHFILSRDSEHKKKIALLTMGLVLFLLSFSWGNFIGSVTEQWAISQLGLFGVPFFGLLLAYMIVRFRAFQSGLLGTQVIIFTLLALIASQILLLEKNNILIVITFLLACFFGALLWRAIKSEAKQKEELQELAYNLTVANKRLIELDAAKSEFVSIASHQLRTPLTAIKGYISLMSEGSYGKIPEPIQDAFKKIYFSNERIIQLVEELLNISRIESGRMSYQAEVIDITDIIEPLQDLFILRTEDKGLAYSTHYPDEAPTVKIDGSKVREVISNLIDNAIKYTDEGFVKVVVDIHGGMVRIRVQDSGIGVPSTMLEDLFRKFNRGEDQSRLHVEGTGLGLYVGKQIVEANGGRIYVDSDGMGKGSTFVVEFPHVRV